MSPPWRSKGPILPPKAPMGAQRPALKLATPSAAMRKVVADPAQAGPSLKTASRTEACSSSPSVQMRRDAFSPVEADTAKQRHSLKSGRSPKANLSASSEQPASWKSVRAESTEGCAGKGARAPTSAKGTNPSIRRKVPAGTAPSPNDAVTVGKQAPAPSLGGCGVLMTSLLIENCTSSFASQSGPSKMPRVQVPSSSPAQGSIARLFPARLAKPPWQWQSDAIGLAPCRLLPVALKNQAPKLC
mmetsp:Transcript_68041/g.133806  ORF Transcript_68041/g.133806 Transcript_68041/m.133806 type:complete len:244 (-) Transcript_68041:53-784(-)